jgi:type II secretory pathway pseudopilin PulG
VLLEQILAIMLLSLVVVGVFSLLATGSLAVRMAQEQTVAASLASEKLEGILDSGTEPVAVPREPLGFAGVPRYEWQADIIEEVSPALRRISVTVWWSRGHNERSVSLTTLVRRRDEP